MSKVTACEACGLETCPYANDDEPCYGEIRPVDDKAFEGRGFVGEIYYHACEGHRFGGMYVPESE